MAGEATCFNYILVVTQKGRRGLEVGFKVHTYSHEEDYLFTLILYLLFVHSVFGHISYRSDWELVKVDFRQSFPRQCTESDYDSWQLSDLQVMHPCTYSICIYKCACVLS